MGINQSMDVCQCLATVGGNEEQVDQRSMDKFKVYTIDCLEKSALPQLITARVCPGEVILKCPLTDKTCMHYNIIAEELIETVNDDASSGKKWVYRFSESRSVDFYLADPQSPETLLSVPAKCFDIKRHALIDGEDETNNQKTIDDPTKITFSTSEDIPKGIASIAAAKKFDLYHSANMFSFAKRVKKNIRYSLFSIYMNEQIAILAIINEPSTSRVKTVTPLLKDCLLPEYFKQYSWSDRDKLAWTALTGDSPCILATKDPKLFQDTWIENTYYDDPRPPPSPKLSRRPLI